MFIVTPRAADALGELVPSQPTGGLAPVPAVRPHPRLRRAPPAHRSQVPFVRFLQPEPVDGHVLGRQGAVPELSLRTEPGFHLGHLLLEHIREGRSGCRSWDGPS